MSTGLQYHVLDVFTEQPLAGNPLSVVLDADDLDAVRMQAIAREFNLSETVFVLGARAVDSAARLRIFTPAHEVPFAGHPTVGTACLLAQLGRVPVADDGAVVEVVLEEEVGRVPVRLQRQPGRCWHAQFSTAVLADFDPQPLDAARLADALGLDSQDIETSTDAPRGASCGLPFVLVPLRSRDALARAQPRAGATRVSAWSDCFYLYFREGDRQIHARMFAPGLGVAEDPATGSAAAALSGHLADRSPVVSGMLSWSILQGEDMQRPSFIGIQADKRDGAVTAIRVGGHSVLIASGTLTL